MAEYIERESMIYEIQFINSLINPENDWLHGYKSGLVAAIDSIFVADAADVVPVVRCKDCKHWMNDFYGCTDFAGCCAYSNYMIGANGYCIYGERKEGAGNEP